MSIIKTPNLTDEQIDALAVGDKIRNIPGDLFHILGILPGKNHSDERVFVLASWSKRHQGWIYRAEPDYAIRALFCAHDQEPIVSE